MDNGTLLTINKPPTKVTIEVISGYSIEAELHIDGDQFGILIGDDLQSGCAAFGSTIDKAVCNFKVAVLNHGVKNFGQF